jgi:hypothetical protein
VEKLQFSRLELSYTEMSNYDFYVTGEIRQYLITSANYTMHIILNIIFPSIVLNSHHSDKMF